MVLVGAAAVVVSEPRVAVAGAVAALVGLAAAVWLRRRRGGLDGDGLGALVVVTGIAGLAAMAGLS
jgi:cobalamin synthase